MGIHIGLALAAVWACAFASGLSAAEAEKPLWTAGVVTDTHVGRDRKGCELVRQACQLFAAHDIDLFICCGDIADRHFPTAYPILKELTDAAFPRKPPRKLWVYANHDHIDRQNEPFETVMGDVKRLLGATNGLYDRIDVNGTPVVVVPQWIDLKRAGGLLDETMAKYPTGPVFVCDHVPATGTGENAVTWGCEDRLRFYAKYPRVIVLTGHSHGSLRSELNIWQGAFTSVNMGCLQVWEGHAVGAVPPSKRNYGAVVMEVYSDRVVFRRFDVRTKAEYSADEPWTVPLPFDPATAPYRRERTKRTEPMPAFPRGAKLTLSPNAPFTELGMTFPRAEGPHGTYAYKVQVTTTDGEPLSRLDLFGQFYLPERERAAVLTRTMSAGYFDAGRRYRVRITPCNFFGVGGKPIEAEFAAPATFGDSVVTYEGRTPHRELGFFRYLKGNERRWPDREGWFRMDRGDFRLELPKGVWAGPKGTRFRFTIDMETEQESVRTWTLVLRNPKPMENANERIATPEGKSGKMRYVIEFEKRRDDFDYYFLVREGDKGRIRFNHIKIERIDFK